MSTASRREFIASASAAASSLLFLAAKESQGRKFEGIYGIPQTPFTESGAVDMETLSEEIRFLHRCGVQGITWPVNASEQSELTYEERIAGAEAIIRANNKGDASVRPAVVIGVQAADGETASKYAQHAEKAGADAIIAIPYKNGISDDVHQMEYYSAIGSSSSKPLFVQAIGNISVDLVLKMAKKIPTLRYVKDEAGNTLQRLNEYRKREPILTGIFTGKNGPTLLDELARGAVGNMPSVGFADLYVATWKAWKAGNQHEAEDIFSKTLLLIVQGQNYGLQGTKYMLQARGVFKNTVCRIKPTPQQTFDAEAKKAMDQSLAYLKPWLKA